MNDLNKCSSRGLEAEIETNSLVYRPVKEGVLLNQYFQLSLPLSSNSSVSSISQGEESQPMDGLHVPY